MSKKQIGPKILFIDIETAPIEARVWGIGDQFITPDRIVKDWSILSYTAKWKDDPKLIYQDNRARKDKRDDSKLLPNLWKLFDEADVVIGQNSKKFDVKKINTRLAMNGYSKPSGFNQSDTLLMSRKNFAFTSNSLAYLTSKLCKKFKKSSHKKFPGNALWDGCLAGNLEAWKEMETYNKIDVLATEELYNILRPWGDTSFNFNVYHEGEDNRCACGSTRFIKKGFETTLRGKFQRYRCSECLTPYRSSKNLLSKEKKATMLVPTR
jgi:hypothetical protein